MVLGQLREINVQTMIDNGIYNILKSLYLVLYISNCFPALIQLD